MKKAIFLFIVCASCANPYTNPDRSSALSLQTQAEQAKQQTEILQKQLIQVTRIADALDSLKNKH